MKLSDRLRRWWNPAKWRDEHPKASEGEGYALSEEQEAEEKYGQFEEDRLPPIDPFHHRQPLRPTRTAAARARA